MTVATDAEPPTFDWPQSTASATQLGAIQVLETLYALDEDYAAVPQLAADEPDVSSDRLTYTIPLRDDVSFHDGTSMEADDVVASLQRWGEVSSNGGPFFEHVDTVEATGTHEVTLKLSAPYDVERALAVPIAAAAIMPEETVAKYGKDIIDNVADIIGTGPYRFTEWRKGRAYELARFGDYEPANNGASGGLAAAQPGTYESVVVNIVQEASTRFQSTAAGQYDVGLSIPGDLYGQFAGQQRIEAQTIRPYYSQYLLLDTSEPPFDDPKVRRALALALDQSKLAEATYGSKDLFTLNGAIYPSGMGVLSSEEGVSTYDSPDIAQAKALLEDSDYDGQTLTFMTSQALSQIYNFSVSAAQQLEAAGFSVELDVTEWATMNGRYTQPESWDMFSTAFGIGYSVPSSHLLLNGSFPFEGWYADDDTMSALVDEWHTARSDSERGKIMDRIQTQFYTDQPAVKLGDYSMLNALSTGVSLDEVTFYLPTWWSAQPR
ncbi:peptide/nickel transport system substrate-binding protein [Brevibacterium linens]|uniref:Peptide/nickel transport system substrate-binding protein n=1 Tax=Brevibacterium linens TaxID=1703 RepID=A0A2H1KM35_BRELN|nr:peptide/nickel transport system substrate-binding protein [Brevibacterium linens]